MIKLDIQLFGGRGASSSNINTTPKKATFLTATYNADKGARENIKVSGVSYKYKGLEIGIYGKKQNVNEAISTPGRGEDNYVAVIITNDKNNGLMLETGKTRKETTQKVNELIDKRKKDILKAMGR